MSDDPHGGRRDTEPAGDPPAIEAAPAVAATAAEPGGSSGSAEPPTTGGGSTGGGSAGGEPDDAGMPAEEPPGEPEPFPAEDVPPDSLRVDPRIAHEMYGDRFDAEAWARTRAHVTAEAPANIGDHGTVNVNYHYAERLKRPVIRDLPYAPEMVKSYAPTSSDLKLVTALDQRPVVCLTGAPGTGRYTSACVALADRRDAGQLHEIVPPIDLGIETIEANKELLTRGHGYVLRLPGNRHAHAVRLLDGVFRAVGASLVLIRDVAPRAGEPLGGEILHHRPDPAEVFARQLRRRLQTSTLMTQDEIKEYVDRCLGMEHLRALLDQTYGPKEVVEMALAVGRDRPEDEAAMAAVLAVSQPSRRDRAIRVLLPDRAGELIRHHRIGQYERAFRISYAVFCHQPLHHVFTATGWLLEQIDGASGRPDLGRTALEHPVPELLGPELGADWRDAREEAAPAPGVSRAAWLRDASMRGAIIDVAWHEFDNTRPALIEWLDRLVNADDRAMQVAAAETAGLLASHDYARVHKELVDRWAASPRRSVRRAAARTAVLAFLADLDGPVATLVRRKVREWVYSPRARQRDTAVLVYAAGLTQPDPGWSLADLHRIAQDPMQRHVQLVAEGVNQLFAPDRLGWLVAELARWVRQPSPLVQTHAARSLLALAARRTGTDVGTPPDMLLRLATTDVEVIDLAALWRIALLDSATGRSAWRQLGDWLRDADASEDLRKPTTELLHEISRWQPVRRRLAHFLPRDWRAVGGVPDWIETALREREDD